MLVARLIIERTIDDDDDLITIRSDPSGIPFIEAVGMLSIADSLIKHDPEALGPDNEEDG